MNLLDFIPGGRLVQMTVLAALAAALIGGITYGVHSYNEGLREDGRAEVRAEQLAKDQAASLANFNETQRRVRAQEESQRVQNAELEKARTDAARNARDAEQLREQNASVAKRWRDTLRDSPTGADREAAADAIGVLADVLGRADKRAGILAAYADAARAAGLKCERDYDALTVKP